MGTRVFCDMCGNTCPSPAKYSFGCDRPRDYDKQVAAQAAAQSVNALYQQQMVQHTQSMLSGSYGGIAGIAGNAGSYAAVHVPARTVVDLCQHCEKIWLERVASITRSSDVPAT